MRRVFFSLVLIAVFCSGCGTNYQVQVTEKPTARMFGIRIQDVQLDYVTLLFDIEINNPYPNALVLKSMNYSITTDGNLFLTATPIRSIIVPPNRKEVVTVPDEVLYNRLLEALNSKDGSEIKCRVMFQLWVEAPDSGLIKLPSEYESKLVLPEAIEIKVEGKIYDSLDVVFIATPQDVVEKMLELANVKKDDLVYDLGCGDGRIPVTAARKYGCRAVGYDLDPRRVQESKENVQKNNVGDLVRIEQVNIFTLDLSNADVITLYLLPKLNVRLIPQLEKLKPGSRIVSHSFDIQGVRPEKVVKLTSSFDQAEHKIYLWTTPLKKRKNQ